MDEAKDHRAALWGHLVDHTEVQAPPQTRGLFPQEVLHATGTRDPGNQFRTTNHISLCQLLK